MGNYFLNCKCQKTIRLTVSETITDELNYMDSESKKGRIIFGPY